MSTGKRHSKGRLTTHHERYNAPIREVVGGRPKYEIGAGFGSRWVSEIDDDEYLGFPVSDPASPMSER